MLMAEVRFSTTLTPTRLVDATMMSGEKRTIDLLYVRV